MKALLTPTAFGIALAVALASFVGATAPMPSQANAQEKPDEPRRPEGVSPARPGIPPPDVDGRYCRQCGAPIPLPKRYHKQKLHRPLLAPGADRKEGGERRAEVTRRRGLPVDRVLRHAGRLMLTDDQIRRLEELSFDTKKTLIGLRAKLQQERLELQRLVRSESVSMTVIRRQLDSVARKKVDVEEVRLAQLFRLREILTDQQRKLIRHRRYGIRHELEPDTGD
jgi:Spy/CpxP family protein refolding chaperone